LKAYCFARLSTTPSSYRHTHFNGSRGSPPPFPSRRRSGRANPSANGAGHDLVRDDQARRGRIRAAKVRNAEERGGPVGAPRAVPSLKAEWPSKVKSGSRPIRVPMARLRLNRSKPERQLSGLDRGQRKSAIFNDLNSAGPGARWKRKLPTNQLPKTGLSAAVHCYRLGRRCPAECMPKRSRDPEDLPYDDHRFPGPRV
jgi:hypothetical protein